MRATIMGINPAFVVTASPRLSWNLRGTPKDQALIDRAVSTSGLMRTDFVLQAARMAAQELLVERCWLGVGAEAFERFANALDAPPQANDRLHRTMTAPKPWQDRWVCRRPSLCRSITTARTSTAAITASTIG